jgi:hypothetical protein
LRNRAPVLALLYSWALVAQTIRIPFVGCPAEDQTGPREAPKGNDQVVRIKKSAARRLAFYTAGGGFGVLAPRGWYCFARYGSSGGPLFVGPSVINANDLFPVAGSAVELEATEGGGSGMSEVAQISHASSPRRGHMYKASSIRMSSQRATSRWAHILTIS